MARVRSERLKHLGLPPDAEYAAREHIAREHEIRRLFGGYKNGERLP